MSKTARLALVFVTTLLLAAGVGLAIFLPQFTAKAPQAAETTEPDQPRLHLQDDRFTVLNEDEETPFPEFRKSKPHGSLDVGYGTPPGYPSGVPVQTDAWVKNNFWDYGDEIRYLFAGGEEEYLAILDQFAYAGWAMDEDEYLGKDKNLRIVHFSNDANRVKVLYQAAPEGSDQWYAVAISPRD